VNLKQENQERDDDPVATNSDWDSETVIEQVWNDLQGRVSRTEILQVILEIIPKYENARIATFVPIFIRRQAVAMLRARIAEPNSDPPIQTPSISRVGASSDSDTAGSLDQDRRFSQPAN
jgi:hypothetical protein